MQRKVEQKRSLTALVAGAINNNFNKITTSEKYAFIPADIFFGIF